MVAWKFLPVGALVLATGDGSGPSRPLPGGFAPAAVVDERCDMAPRCVRVRRGRGHWHRHRRGLQHRREAWRRRAGGDHCAREAYRSSPYYPTDARRSASGHVRPGIPLVRVEHGHVHDLSAASGGSVRICASRTSRSRPLEPAPAGADRSRFAVRGCTPDLAAVCEAMHARHGSQRKL